MIYTQYQISYRGTWSVTPVIIDEDGCLDLLIQITGQDVATLDECQQAMVSHVSLYDIPEGKKLFDIGTIRRFIQDLELIPYESRHIYILRSIDLGTPEAMNALLKSLEDCPIYACIILVVSDPEALLETIRSRAINLYQSHFHGELKEELRHLVDQYIVWDTSWLILEIFTKKFEKDEAISLLEYLTLHDTKHYGDLIEQGIIDIRMSHESPRNILDGIFLIPR